MLVISVKISEVKAIFDMSLWFCFPFWNATFLVTARFKPNDPRAIKIFKIDNPKKNIPKSFLVQNLAIKILTNSHAIELKIAPTKT